MCGRTLIKKPSFQITMKHLNKIQKRSLGKTGEHLSIIGFGGIVIENATPEEAASRVKEAIDYGVNYFDVAPAYGNAEEKLGPALKPYRKDVFLACKTKERKKEGARRELEQSLRTMETNHFDLYQFHEVSSVKEVETILGPGGAMETFLEAREEGKIKYIGFSAHSVDAGLALMDNFDFDTILFPLNFATWYAGNFGPQLLARAMEKEMGILALKAMAWKPWGKNEVPEYDKTWYKPVSDREEARKGLRFTLSQPVTSAIPPGEEDLFSMALELASEFTPMNEDEMLEMKNKAEHTTPIFNHHK